MSCRYLEDDIALTILHKYMELTCDNPVINHYNIFRYFTYGRAGDQMHIFCYDYWYRN